MSPCELRPDLSILPALPLSPEGDPVFAEPWQAQVFAMTVLLHERGVFSWPEWAASLSRALHAPGLAEDGTDYFDAWVEALVHLLEAKGLAERDLVESLRVRWQRAAEATPHGQIISLGNAQSAD